MKIKSKIGELFFQIIPVMIGVYLGFLVSDWSNEKEKNAKKTILVESIISEIQENKKNVLKVIEYHVMLKDSSRYYNKNNAEVNPDFFRGINHALLLNSAFETGIQTGLLNDLTIDKIQSLNRLYKTQNSYNEYINIIISGLVNMDLNENEESIKKVVNFLSITMEDVTIMETQLLNGFESNLNSLKEN